MAFIDCPKCGQQVSDDAETCPSCGQRSTKRATQLELELARIDLDWERQRQQYLVMRGPFGGTQEPRKRTAVWGALFVVFIGIGLGAAFAPAGEGAGACLGGGIVALVAIFVGVWAYSKAEGYEQAEAEYLRRREAAKSKFANGAGTQDGPQ